VGTVNDVYDFVYDKNPRECQVQTGYPTLGIAGKVFKTTFILNNRDLWPRYDWNW
jgi:hypothetical protein